MDSFEKIPEKFKKNVEELEAMSLRDHIAQIVHLSDWTSTTYKADISQAELTRRLIESINRFDSSTTKFSWALIGFAVVQTAIMVVDICKR